MRPALLLNRIMAPALALAWLLVQQWGSSLLTGFVACLVIAALMMSPICGNRSSAAQLGMLFLLLLLGAWVFLLNSGIHGPRAYYLFIVGMLLLGLCFPLLYALGMPRGDQS